VISVDDVTVDSCGVIVVLLSSMPAVVSLFIIAVDDAVAVLVKSVDAVDVVVGVAVVVEGTIVVSGR